MDKYVRLFHLRKDYKFSRVRLQQIRDIDLNIKRPSLPEILKPGTNFLKFKVLTKLAFSFMFYGGPNTGCQINKFNLNTRFECQKSLDWSDL